MKNKPLVNDCMLRVAFVGIGDELRDEQFGSVLGATLQDGIV